MNNVTDNIRDLTSRMYRDSSHAELKGLVTEESLIGLGTQMGLGRQTGKSNNSYTAICAIYLAQVEIERLEEMNKFFKEGIKKVHRKSKFRK